MVQHWMCPYFGVQLQWSEIRDQLMHFHVTVVVLLRRIKPSRVHRRWAVTDVVTQLEGVSPRLLITPSDRSQ